MHTLHVIFTSTRSKTGAFLRIMTRRKVNHVSLKPDDEDMCSYRRERPHNVLSGRFGSETLEGMKGGYPYYVEQFDIPVPDEAYEKVKERIRAQHGHKYDFLGCTLLWFGKEARSTKRMFCSNFAAYVLEAAIPLEKPYGAYTPDDLRLELKKNYVSTVKTGKLSEETE